MTGRSTLQYLEDARDHALLADRLAAGTTLDMLKSALELSHAIRSCLTVVGEATRAIPDDLKLRHPDIPWAAIWGLRNRLVHAYWRIDLDTILRILRDDVPLFVAELDRMIADTEREGS